MKSGLFIAVILLIVTAIFSNACAQQPIPPVTYSVPELKYILLAHFDDVFYVDPDFYPIAREGQEDKNALEQFPIISADTTEFSAILKNLELPNKTDYTNEEKLLIYREHKRLSLAIEMTVSGNIYRFVLRVGKGQGERVEGTITPSGKIVVLKREPSFNTYPICLTEGTLIATPSGSVPVEELRKGLVVYTADDAGKRIVTVLVETTIVPVSCSFQVVKVRLNDGRTVATSPGHPTAEGQPLGEYRVGDTLDGGRVITVEHIIYNGDATYDLLPAGSTGLYWANGILLKSTLAD